MALFKKQYKRIELYGFEMATDTEYAYQKGGAEFFVGLAAGMGIDVWLPERCQLMDSAVYGYEATQMIDLENLIKFKGDLEKDQANAHEKLNYWGEKIQKRRAKGQDYTEFTANFHNAEKLYFTNNGGLQIADSLIERCEELPEGTQVVSRQSLEKLKVDTEHTFNQEIGRLNFISGKIDERKTSGKDTKRLALQYHEQERLVSVISGGSQVLEYLIKRCDLLDPGGKLENKLQITRVDRSANPVEMIEVQGGQ